MKLQDLTYQQEFQLFFLTIFHVDDENDQEAQLSEIINKHANKIYPIGKHETQ